MSREILIECQTYQLPITDNTLLETADWRLDSKPRGTLDIELFRCHGGYYHLGNRGLG